MILLNIQCPLFLAGLALLSALLSNYAQSQYTTLFDAPVLPGLYFSLVIGAAIYLWAGRSLFRTGMAMVLTVLGWILAFLLTLHIYSSINDDFRNMMHPQEPKSSDPISLTVDVNYLAGMCGLVGGFVGSATTVIGVSVAARQFETVEHWTRTILIGTVLGFLLEMYAPPMGSTFSLHFGSALPLFVCWQMGVAASVAYELSLKASSG